MIPVPRDRTASERTNVAGASRLTSQREVQTLNVNRSSFEELFLQCQVCYQMYDKSERKPKTLQCGHVFCLPCLLQLFAQSQAHFRNQKTLKCPSCRNQIITTEEKINELPNDFRVAQMLDFMNQAVATTGSQNMCSKHRSQELNFFCKNCSVPVCRDCTVVEHKDSDNHEIIDVHQVLGEHRAQFEVNEKLSKEILKNIRNRAHYLVNGSKNLRRLEHNLKKEIDEKFAEYQQVLQQRQETLKRLVHEKITDQRLKIKVRHSMVCDQFRQFECLYKEFTQSTHSSDTRRSLTINHDMEAHASEFMAAAYEDDADLFQSCELSVDHWCSLIALSGIAEVIVKSDQELKEEPELRIAQEMNENEELWEHLSVEMYNDDEDDLALEELIQMFDNV